MFKQRQLKLIAIIIASFITFVLSGVVLASGDTDLQAQTIPLSIPTPDPHPSNTDNYIVHTSSPTDIYIEYLQEQTVPIFSDNVYSQHITAEPNCTVTERPTLLTLTGGDFLAIWSGDGCYARFVRNGLGEFESVDTVAWLDTTGWLIEQTVSGDINQDGADDLIIFWHTPTVGELRDAYYIVALAQPSGRFDLTMEPILFAENVRAIYPNMMDVNDDGYLDLLYEPLPTAGQFTTEVYAVYGADNQITFGSEHDLLVTLPYGASTLLGSIGDLNNDTHPDIWLGSDDDNVDEGQSWLLLNDGEMSFTVQESFDTDENEGGGYNGNAHHPAVTTCDVNLDGNADVLTREKPQAALVLVSHKVHLGDGSGRLSQDGIVLAEEVGSIYPAAVCGYIPTDAPTPPVNDGSSPTPIPPVPTMTPTPIITEPIVLEIRSGLEDVLLRWQLVEPLEGILDHYNVYKYQLGTVIVPILVSSQLGSHYVDDGDFSVGQNYCYYVEAIDEAGAVITESNINCATFGELQLVVPHVVLPPDGKGIAVPVTVLNGNGLCPVSLDITLAYDSQLVAAVDVQQTAYTADYRFEASIDQPGRVSIASISGNCDTLAGSGALFNILFDVAGDVGAMSTLEFIEGITATAIYNEGENEPTVLRMVNGSLTIGESATRGDINGDQFINAFDAFLALQVAVGAVEPTLQQTISCDVNGDGSCNTADSSLLLCYAAYETWDSCDATMTKRSARRQVMTTLSKGELLGGMLPILLQGGTNVSGGTVTLTYDPTLIEVNGIETENSLLADWSVTTDEEIGLLRVAFADSESIGTDGTLFTINATPIVEGATIEWAGAQFNNGLGLDWESNLGHTIVYENSTESIPLSVAVHQQTAWSSISFVSLFMLLLCGLTVTMWRVCRID